MSFPSLLHNVWTLRGLLVADWAIALGWLLRVLIWRFRLPLVPDLTLTDYRKPGAALPKLSVIVPARNEVEHIAATLHSLLASRGVVLDVLAVNDRSDDGTGTVMDEVARTFAAQGGAAHVSLQVLHVAELPAGWLGKTNAMATAGLLARGDWLLFTDADVLFQPDALERALAFGSESQADHLVLLPTVVLRSWGERMMIAFLQVLSLWAVRPWRVPDPRAKRDAIGVGAFNMIRRPVYDELGGWGALRMEVLEDLALGRRVKAQGFAQRVALGLDLVRVRWAQSALGVVENLTKNLFALFDFRAERLLAFACGLALFTLFPLAACFAAKTFWWPAGVLLLALVSGYGWTGRYHHFSWVQVVTYPLASGLFLYALLRSMSLALWRGGITWRGTFYPLRALRRGP